MYALEICDDGNDAVWPILISVRHMILLDHGRSSVVLCVNRVFESVNASPRWLEAY